MTSTNDDDDVIDKGDTLSYHVMSIYCFHLYLILLQESLGVEKERENFLNLVAFTERLVRCFTSVLFIHNKPTTLANRKKRFKSKILSCIT